MKTILAVALSAMLAGCTSSPVGVRVHWIKADSDIEVERLCFRAGARSPNAQMIGCQYWNGSTCTVIVKVADEVILGHEVRHCFDGRFHGRGPTHG